jgi:hypothetical protein
MNQHPALDADPGELRQAHHMTLPSKLIRGKTLQKTTGPQDHGVSF